MELLKCVWDSCTHSHKLDEYLDALLKPLVGVVALDAIKVREEAIKKNSSQPAQIEENMSERSCQCKQDPHKMIALVMPFPTVGGTSCGSSWLMRY